MVQQISNLLLVVLFAIISSAEKPVFVGIIKITSLHKIYSTDSHKIRWQEKNHYIFCGNRHHIFTFVLGLGWG